MAPCLRQFFCSFEFQRPELLVKRPYVRSFKSYQVIVSAFDTYTPDYKMVERINAFMKKNPNVLLPDKVA
ncbi:hypothetical protein LENED_006649 [Lentinula edodes]|uniref:Uncharacterized protein n=1 Tax=Lentinula edodes TaxID=5353 RepID=A0A1Q3ECH3_LENED|nr:hypothetical protein LENED_006649 [Lentinula edodes]